MTFAHIAGVPFEEWLGPLLASGTGMAVVAIGRLRDRAHRARR